MLQIAAEYIGLKFKNHLLLFMLLNKYAKLINDIIGVIFSKYFNLLG